MKSAVEKGAEYFLERELHIQGDRYEPWYRFHYPVHYYYDMLVGLDFMTALGYADDRRMEFAQPVSVMASFADLTSGSLEGLCNNWISVRYFTAG